MAGHNKINRKKFLAASAMALTTAMITIPGAANADSLPFDLQHITGDYTTTTGPNQTTIDQASMLASGKGNTSIPLDYFVTILQPNGGIFAAIDNTGHASEILGHLTATSNVYVFNENGVIFGKDAVINVGGLLATTARFDADKFMNNNGKLELTDFGDNSIVNNGTITINGAGLAALVAPTVVNNGIIQAKLGKVVLAAGGEKATVDMYGDGLIELTLGDSQTVAKIENTGTIEGKTVLMTAAAAKNVVDTVINMSGVVNASSVSEEGGKIVLNGGSSGKVSVSGKLDASGANGGGEISVTGHDVEVANGAMLLADSYDTGNGGKVAVIADNNAIFEGDVYARGGQTSGDGGAVEISGKNQLGYDGAVNTSAVNGVAGSLLFDPNFAIIHSGSLHNPLGLQYILSAQALANDLARNGSLTVQADNSIDVGTNLPGLGNGPIDLADYNYNELNTHGSPFFWNWTYDNHSGITAGNISLVSNTVNFNKDTTIGTGVLNVNANTVNLNSKLYRNDGTVTSLMNQGNITTTAGVVNVLSNNALIQQGLYLAKNTGTVNVAAGTYNENLDIAKSVTLKGAKAGVSGAAATRGTSETIVNGALGDNHTIDVIANAVTIDGIIVDGHNNSAQTGINIAGANNATVKNTIVKNTTYGIYTGALAPTGLLISNNLVDHASITGISLTNAAGAEVSGNTIKNGGGISAATSSGVKILNNTLAAITGDGVNVANSNGAALNGNSVNQASGYGLIVTGSDNVVIGTGAAADRNTVDGVSLDGIKLSGGTGSIIENNQVSSAARVGIYADHADHLTIKNNVVSHTTYAIGTPYGGISTDWGSNITISGNTISGSGQGVRLYDATGLNNITGNTINAVTEKGVFVQGTDNVTVSANLIGYGADGVLGGDADSTIGGDGVYVEGAISGSVAGNKIAHTAGNGINLLNVNGVNVSTFDVASNTIGDSKADGVHIEGGKFASVYFNAIDLVTGAGVASNNTVSDNIRFNQINNAGIGIAANNANGIDIAFNNIGVGADGVFGGDADSIITGNGISLGNTTGASIRNNVVGNTGGNGLNLSAANSVDVHDNTITKTGLAGVKIAGGSDETFTNNTLAKTGQQGFVVNGTHKNLTLDKNHLANIGWSGIQVDSGTNLNVTGNDITKAGGNGMIISGTQTVNVADNNIKNVNASGVIANGTTYTTINHNTVTGAGANGIQLSNNTGTYTQVIYNTVDTTTNDGIHIVNAKGLFVGGNNVGTHDGGIKGNGIFVDPSTGAWILGNTVTGAALNGIVSQDNDDAKIQQNVVSGSGLNGILVDGGTNVLVGGDTGETYNKNTISSSGLSGIEINGADNAKAGYNKITGGTDSGIRIDNSDHVTLNKNDVSGTAIDGIRSFDSDYLTATGNTVHDVAGSGIGLLNSDHASLTGNHITGNIGRGFWIGQSNDVTISGNDVTGAATYGVFLTNYGGADDQVVIKNNVIKGGQAGIFVEGGATNVTIGSTTTSADANTITGSSVDGVAVTGGGTVKIGYNKIDSVGRDAVHAGNVSSLIIQNNQIGQLNGANNIGRDGVHVEGSASADISANQIANAVGNGIFLDPSNVAFLYSNIINGVGGNGIWSLNNDDANIYGNTITGAGKDGILVQGGNNVNIGGLGANTIKKSGDDGIDVENTTGTVLVKNNVIEETGLDVAPNQYQSGIEVSGTTGATIALNKIKKAAWDGINVQQSSNTVIKSNQIFDTLDEAGIAVHNGSSNVTIDDNVITKSVQYGVWVNDVTGPLTITNNDISDIKLVSGILVSGSTGTIKINNNDIYNVGNDGITAYGDIDEVNGNRILKTGANGINVANSANVDIKSNKIGEAIGTNTATRIRTTNGSSPSTQNTSSAAVAGNIGADGIHVEGSDYAEIISNAVSNTVDDGIESNGNNHITIGGLTAADGNTITGAGAHGINVQGGVSALIQNNTVKGGNGSLFGAAAGAKLDGVHVDNNEGVEILNNTITAGQGITFFGLNGGNGANQNGIFVSNSDNAVIGANMILPDQAGSGLGAGVDGIHVENSDNLTVGGLLPILNGNTILSTGRDGINIDGSTGALVLSNIVSGANTTVLGLTIGGEIGGDGIQMKNTLGSLVAGNIITHVAGNGIVFTDGSLSGIDLNVITDAGENGIEISNSSLLAVGLNQITTTGKNGIALNGVLLAAVLDNNISKTGADGINAVLGAGLLIDGNTIKTTGGDGVDAGFVAFVNITNNTIDDTTGDGVRLFAALNGTVNDNTIINTDGNGINAALVYNLDVQGNGIKHAGANGVAATLVANADISNNIIDDVKGDGVQLLGALDATINGNTISNAKDDGIDAAFVYGLDINGNTVDLTGDNGIEAKFIANANVNTNKIGLAGNVGGNGIDLRNSANVTIATNDIGTNVAGNGIFVDPSFNITIDDNNVDGVGVDGIHAEDTTGLIISNNIVTSSGQDGVEVRNSDKVQLLSNLISNSGSRGLYLSGQNNGSVVLKGNVFTDNPTGAEFETGKIDLTGLGADANTFTGGNVAMVFDPTAPGDPLKLSLKDNTIGETKFDGQTTYYVKLAHGAFFAPGTPTIIDGYHATFDGFRPDTVPFLTLAQFDAINAKLFDYRDDNTLGLFFIGNVPEVDQEDILRQFGAFGGTSGKFRITITGLPRTGGTGSFAGGGNIANLLASITPAAGGNDNGKQAAKEKVGAADIANIEPAAGVDTAPVATNDNAAASDTACWSQAVAKASSGAPVDYSFGGTMEEAITQTASCGSGSQF